MRLIVLQSDSMISDVVVGRESVYIGSRQGCRVHIPDNRVAEQHCVIYPEPAGSWMLERLADSADVQVNGSALAERVALKTGDEIRIFDYTIRTFPDHAPSAVAATPPAASSGTGVSVESLTKFVQYQLPYGSTIKKVDEQLTLAPGQLTRLGQVNLSSSQCIVPEALMNIALQTMMATFGAQRVWIGIRRVNYGKMEYVEGRSAAGHPVELPEHGHNLQPRVLDRSQFVLVPQVSSEDRLSIMAGPLAGPDGTLGMVYVDSGDSARHFELHDLDHFILFLTIFALQLDAIFKEIARNRQATLDGEVSVAHEIQARLTPRKLPQWEELQFGAFREPGRQRTGDIYDVVRLTNGWAALMVAHTQSTGALPVMLMAQAQAVFRSSAAHQDAPHVFLRTLNWLLYDGQKDHPLDCFMAYIDPATGQMRYAVAGWMGAYIIDQRGEERRLGGKERGASLSLEKNLAAQTLSEQLERDETMVLFTPGVTTAKSSKGETFGEERFVNTLCDNFGQLASSVLKEMLSDLQSFTERGMQPDDITVLLAHRV